MSDGVFSEIAELPLSTVQIPLMECALCRENRSLCNSHIVPDFLFQKLRENGGSFFVFSSKFEEPFKEFHKTFSEKLLCENCETLFSKWEHYAKRFLSNEVLLSGRQVGRHLLLAGADYKNLKLFFMSLLWRFGVSTNPWMKGCNLGPHKEKLRQLLLASNPAECWRYGCTITAVLLNRELMPDLIIPPRQIRPNRHRMVRLVVGGYLLDFLTSSHPPDSTEQLMVLQEDGSFYLFRQELTKIRSVEEIVRFAASRSK